jgi:hypothetical protein
MAELKFNLNSSDKIKALLGDLNQDVIIEASAFFSFIKEQITLQDVTDNGASTTVSIHILQNNAAVITLNTNGVITAKNVDFIPVDPASVAINTIGVDFSTGRLYFKNNINQVIYLDGDVGTLTFNSGTGELSLTDDLGNVSSVNLDGRYINISEIGLPFGVAPLGDDAKIPSSFLPAVPINNTFVVANTTARLALVANIGDVAVQTDTQESYILQATPPANPASWVKLLFPASVVSVNSQTGVVSLSTTNIPEGANKYASSANVNPLISQYLGRGIFLYNGTAYTKYNTIQDAITASALNDVIVLSNITISSLPASIVINKDIIINSITSFIFNNGTFPIFTDNGANTSLYIRGELYLRNNNTATAFQFTGTGGLLYLDGEFDFRDTKTTFNCNKYYYLKGIHTQPSDVMTFNSSFGGTILSKGVGVVNYFSANAVTNFTGAAAIINANGVNLSIYQEKDIFDINTYKAGIGRITSTGANIAIYNQLISSGAFPCVTNVSGTSSLRAYNTIFVSNVEVFAVTAGALNCQLGGSQLTSGSANAVTTTPSLSILSGYSYGNKPIGGLGSSGQYLENIGFTSPVL